MISLLKFILGYLFSVWWLILPLLVWFIVKEKHLITVRYAYRGRLKWIFIEIKVPPYVKKSPKAMEEIFNALHGIFRRGDPWSRFMMGFTPPFYVFEIVGHNGKLRFIIRCLEQYKDFVASRIYSQYPEALIEEIEDPLKDLPWKIPNPTFDVIGCEFVFTKLEDDKKTPKDYYPIKTYEVWEKLPEEQRIDPISILSEGATYLSNKEWLIIQIMAMPVPGNDKEFGREWVTRGKKEVNKLMGRKEKKEPSPFDYIIEFVKNLFLAAAGQQIEWKVGKEEEKKEAEKDLMKLTPGEREIIEGIERKISKPGYWCVVRFCYVASKDVFSANRDKNVGLVMGTFRVFERQDMNGLVRDTKTIPSIDRPLTYFKSLYDEKIFYRKRLIWAYTKGRWNTDYDENRLVLNTEELASLFHVPIEVVPQYGLEVTPTRYIPPSPEVPEI